MLFWILSYPYWPFSSCSPSLLKLNHFRVSSIGRPSPLYFAMSAMWFEKTSKMLFTTSALDALRFVALVKPMFSRRYRSVLSRSGLRTGLVRSSVSMGK